MQGRAFLDLSRELLLGKTEAHWRAAVIHAYYGLFLECRDAQTRWGLPTPPRHSVHAQVRLRFAYATDAQLKKIGDALDRLIRHRNRASYDLATIAAFGSSSFAQQMEKLASDALSWLDQIDNDPLRRAAAIASLPP